MMFYPMFYFDPTYVLILIGVVMSVATSTRLDPTYRRYSTVRGTYAVTGAEATKRLLTNQGIYDVTVRHIPGDLTDHYDPRSKAVNLSDAVYSSAPITAIEVAAHEHDHAMQDANDCSPLRICVTLVPATNLGSQLCWFLIIIGLLLGGSSVLLNLGILLFCLVVLFQLVTLPVEYDTSHRVVNLLNSTGILMGQEVGRTRKVLNAAALTHVAITAASIFQLLRLLILSDNRRSGQGRNSYSDRP